MAPDQIAKWIDQKFLPKEFNLGSDDADVIAIITQDDTTKQTLLAGMKSEKYLIGPASSDKIFTAAEFASATAFLGA
ncbi:MAG: hypothetical protein R3D52_12050 [Xanthobacteraceae bacterium]